eukprot:scpid95564/ scgid5553/ Phospholipase A2; Group IB phospholipase A2; Phosphatidylcholine 2-acylhydrolase 1B
MVLARVGKMQPVQLFLLGFAAIFIAQATGNALAERSSDVGYGVSKRSLLNFGHMVACAIPNVGNAITAAARYNKYGCYCGVGGSGTPVDPIDRCCQAHDACYGAVTAAGCKTSYTDMYHWQCKRGVPECTTSKFMEHFGGKNNKCENKSCACDREISMCFKRHNNVYDSKHVHWFGPCK